MDHISREARCRVRGPIDWDLRQPVGPARVDPTVNFNWGIGSPDPAVGADQFSARWTGQVQAKYSQAYTFTVKADDGVRLVGAPQGCVPAVTGPQPIDLKNTRIIPAVFWQALDGSKTAGLQFVNRITVTCR